jgi:hypothetical protein
MYQYFPYNAGAPFGINGENNNHQDGRRETCNAKMRGMNRLPQLFGLGPSINFWSTTTGSLPFDTTSTTTFTEFGIHVVPSGKTCLNKKAFKLL